MIAGLDQLLEETNQPGLGELRGLVGELLDAPGASGFAFEAEKLKRSRIYRLRFEIDGKPRSLVAKRFAPHIAAREQALVRRWLPGVGLGKHGPPLLGRVAERSGRCVWHVYRDLGEITLGNRDPNPEQVRAALRLVAQVHMRFANHALLGECRSHGGELGMGFYTASVADAIRALEALRSPRIELAPAAQQVRERLLEWMQTLWEDRDRRSRALEDCGGPDTLLHGDLWTSNILVRSSARGHDVRLIDWDHVGVGPVSYDLSALLLRFPASHRSWVLETYRDALSWTLPDVSTLNLLFETAERARLAQCAVWPAIYLLEGATGWPLDELSRVAQWLDALEPVFPATDAAAETGLQPQISRIAKP
jgi:hypothetical protein